MFRCVELIFSEQHKWMIITRCLATTSNSIGAVYILSCIKGIYKLIYLVLEVQLNGTGYSNHIIFDNSINVCRSVVA